MKILAISYALPPMLYPQAIQIGRLLAYSEHDVLAVSGGESVDRQGFGGRVEHHIVPFKDESKGRLHALAIRALPFYGKVPDAFAKWTDAAFSAITSITDRRGKPDLLVTFGEPMSDHLLGLRLKQSLNLPWLAHFSDPWSDNPFRNIQPLSRLANLPLERRVVQAADRIVFTSEETADLVCRKYNKSVRARSSVLPHSFDPDAYGPDNVDRPSDQVTLRYIGNFYGHRSPKPLVRALAYLADKNPDVLSGVRIELIGGVPARMRSAEWRRLPDGLLVAPGGVSYAESLRLMKASDILLTIDAPARESVFFPSKLADYIGARKRLVGIVPPGAAARIIDECGGRSIDPSAPVEMIAILLRDEIAAVRAQRMSDPSEPPTFGNDARFAVARVAPRFDELCLETVEFPSVRAGVAL